VGRDIALLLLISFAAFWFNLGKLGLIDPAEPFYALTAREMVQSGDWITPRIFGGPQFEKPIFYYWLAAGSFAIFGETEFAGRLPTAVSATVLVLLTYWMGRRLFGRRAALISGVFMATGIVLLVMGRLMLTDIPLTIFVVAALYCYWAALQEPERRDRWIFWHMVATGMAMLTKGPIGSLIPLLGTLSFTVLGGKPFLLRGRGFWAGLTAYAVIVLPWYTTMLVKHGWPFFEEFFIRDNWLRFLKAEHPANNHMWYYPGVLLLGSIPWLPGALLAVRELFRRRHGHESLFFVQCWFWANLLFLTAAASKLPSYGFYLFVPLALALGKGTDRILKHGLRTPMEKWGLPGAAAIQVIVVFGGAFLPLGKPFASALYVFAVFLAAALLFLALRRYRPWLVSTTLSGVVFAGVLLVFYSDVIDEACSVRPIARRIEEIQRPGEVLMAGKFAVRGIAFYTGQPVSVIANKAQPFWAAPPLKIVGGKKELREFLKQRPGALVTMRMSEWHKYYNDDVFAAREEIRWYGKNLLIRGLPRKPKAPKGITSKP
jgi:4-amino-4-deoxy-L-arabinose transferase-like glycosyltransferase